MQDRISHLIKDSIDVKLKTLQDPELLQTVEKVVHEVVKALQADKKILFCGNGGSAADAQHIAAELSGRFYHDRDPLFAEALHVNTSYLTAVANDYGYDHVYSRLVKAKGRPGDVLFGISTSGNSTNITEALRVAREQGMVTVSMTGLTGGKMRGLSDLLLNVPSTDTPRIQEVHILLGHIICELVERELFPPMMLYPEEAIILAGGMGTRLQSVVSEVPKPMAPVAGKPFLEYLFPMLKQVGVKRVVLSVGHKWEVIQAHFGANFMGIEVDYAVESTPLGTGGGIKLAFEKTTSQHVLVLNGDTLFLHDLMLHWEMHQMWNEGALISLALKEMRDFDRYGTVEIYKNERVKAFREKQPKESGLINAGVYVIDRELWNLVDVPEKFSFEKDVLERYVRKLRFMGYKHEGYFIDIGIPEDYEKANRDLVNFDWTIPESPAQMDEITFEEGEIPY